MNDDTAPSVTLSNVINPDGMVAKWSYVVFDSEAQDILAMDIIGADSAVKAIWATLVQPNKWVRLEWRSLRCTGPVAVIRTTLAQAPPLFRWHVHVAPTENDLRLLVYGWNDVMPAHTALVGALARWTVWPVLPAWGGQLYELGVANHLILEHRSSAGGIKVVGDLDYAFLVATATQGWDQVIDKAVKGGRLALN